MGGAVPCCPLAVCSGLSVAGDARPKPLRPKEERIYWGLCALEPREGRWCGQAPGGLGAGGPAIRLLPLLVPEGPFHSLRESISVASANRALGAGEGCPAGLVGVPQPRRLGTGTVTAAPLPPHGWNAGKGHRKAVALSQKRADIKGDRLKPSHPALFFSSVRQKPPSPWSLLGPLHPLTTSGHLLLPMLVPRPKALLPSPFMQIPPGTQYPVPGTRGLHLIRQSVLPRLLQPLCVSLPHLE